MLERITDEIGVERERERGGENKRSLRKRRKKMRKRERENCISHWGARRVKEPEWGMRRIGRRGVDGVNTQSGEWEGPDRGGRLGKEPE